MRKTQEKTIPQETQRQRQRDRERGRETEIDSKKEQPILKAAANEDTKNKISESANQRSAFAKEMFFYSFTTYVPLHLSSDLKYPNYFNISNLHSTTI